MNVSENNSTTDSSLFRLEGEYSCVFLEGKPAQVRGSTLKHKRHEEFNGKFKYRPSLHSCDNVSVAGAVLSDNC